MPQIIRQIPRAEPVDPVEKAEDPPAVPPEPFFWTKPAEPEPGTLRSIPALIGDTFRFIVRRWRALLIVAIPAAGAVVLSSLANWWGFEQIYDDIDGNTSGLRLTLGALVAMSVFALGTYFFSNAVACLVVQHARDEPTHTAAAARIAVRRLPRVTIINLVYGLGVAAVYLPLEFLIGPFLFDRELMFLLPWLSVIIGIAAYGAPQINVYFTAIKLEDRRPKFRRARDLVRGQRAAILGRVMLCQLVLVVSQVIWPFLGLEFRSVTWIVFNVFFVLVRLTILTTAFTLLYVDLAGVSADDPVPEDETALNEGWEAGDGGQAQRPT